MTDEAIGQTLDRDPVELELPVDGGTLRVLRFGAGPRTAVAAHGITASGMSFRAPARHLPPEWSLFALDLRGRGGSADAPGPYGIDAQAADLCAAAERWGGGAPVAVTGQSMGACAALRAAARRPELFDRLLLIDGGLPIPLEEGTDPDALLDASMGPILARLTRTFENDEAYVDVFRAHPALGPEWNDDIEAYVRDGITGPAGARRSSAREGPVRRDGRELIASGPAFGEDLVGLAVPARLLHAPRGLTGAAPGVLSDALVAHWTARAPRLTAEAVPDCNHFTILMGPQARTVADRLVGMV
ncbi:alpha/beta fold hydrolase [Streptomyces sp. NPDC058423]|uniref:alpha/beta fold hydrolase n=1 Tax=unclassified Streptomyces TaxID=2593676 RepID=UPI00364F4C17